MKNLFLKTVLFLTLGILLGNCKQEELDLTKFSNKIKIERTHAMPLVYGDIFLGDLVGNDSVLIIEGDSSFTDTIEFNISEDELANFELEFFDLHHSAKNYLPIGLNLTLITYDSATSRNLDTIRFTEEAMYLPPAELDDNGYVIESSVDSVTGILSIDNRTAENILNIATHIILDARMLSDTTRIIPVNEVNRIWIKYGFHAKGTYYSY